MKENGFTLKKAGSRRYLVESIMVADYANDLAILANTPAQVKSLLHSLEQAARGSGLNGNSYKIKFIYFKEGGAIFTLNSKPLKLLEHFT